MKFVTLTDLYGRPEIVNRFKLMEAVRYRLSALEDIKQPNFEVIDPIGNSLLQLAIHNSDTKLFFKLAKEYSKLLNLPNMYGHTVITSIGVMQDRFPDTKFLDWKQFLTLPFDFSNKHVNFDGLELHLFPLLVFELMRNKEVWGMAKDRIENRKTVLEKVFCEIPTAIRIVNRLDEECPLGFEALELFMAEGKTYFSS